MLVKIAVLNHENYIIIYVGEASFHYVLTLLEKVNILLCFEDLVFSGY